VEDDTIDFEMRLYEGEIAIINNVIIKGNTRTNEHVVRRELRTLPGDKFSKSELIRTVRELANLGHFDPEQIEPNPIPNQADGSVDIEYKLVERATDQLEVSGGMVPGCWWVPLESVFPTLPQAGSLIPRHGDRYLRVTARPSQ